MHAAASDRSLGASIALHGTLIVATFVALFPVLWVLLSSFKPANRIQTHARSR